MGKKFDSLSFRDLMDRNFEDWKKECELLESSKLPDLDETLTESRVDLWRDLVKGCPRGLSGRDRK